ncbi:MAG: replication-associated recombination protein A, partial [Anaerolineaceae bacterium]|nr:replication-associated recombination protein A [Anaerolineaceae bacterium]
PEGIYPIVEATLYLATAPKSNSASGYFEAVKLIEAQGAQPVPIHLMDANRDGEGFGHGKGYKYPHNYPGHFTEQQYLPDGVQGEKFYQPSDEGYEVKIKKFIEGLKH